MTAITLGIDPGLHGGIAAVDGQGNLVGVWPMPLAGNEVNAAQLGALLRNLRIYDTRQEIARAVVEKVGAMPKQGVASTFRFGTGWGMIRGVLAGLCVPTLLVPPTVWKPKVLLGLPHDKAGAVQFCASRWPMAHLIQPGCRKPHDGIADALCLAEYGRLLETKS